MVFSAVSYFTNPMVAQGFHHLGFPDYFRQELGYNGDTPNQYAVRFIAQGVERRDFERRHGAWRWIVHPQPAADAQSAGCDAPAA